VISGLEAQKEETGMKDGSRVQATAAADCQQWPVIGLDLSDKSGVYVELDPDPAVRGVVGQGVVRLTEAGLQQRFGGPQRYRIAIEVGAHSPWVYRYLRGLGHTVILANPRQVALIARSRRKDDRIDAETLARLARFDPELLHPTHHRSEQAQADLAVIRARHALVVERTKLANFVRGEVKAQGGRLPSCSTPAFALKVREAVPVSLRPARFLILEQIATLTEPIKHYDRTIAQLAKEQYPQTAFLQRVTGVGTLTALAFILTLEDPARFPHSRTVGAYLGLTPRQDQSGELRPQLPISKADDEHRRWLLVQCAHYMLGPFGPDCDLRRWGLRLAGAGSQQRKKKAVAAVARKLAVLLHYLWKTGVVYEPLYDAERKAKTAAA
jgi:transposase